MKNIFKNFALLTLFTLASVVQAAPVGKPAPDFSASDSNGKTHKLAEYKGKFVVLEWHNKDCPFVKSHYKGKMQTLQAKWRCKGVQWIAVVSSAPRTEGYVKAAEANADMKKSNAHPTAVFLDPRGTIGHAYDAKTTPHMFIIDPKGILVYNGAIDNAPLTDEVVSKTKEGEPYMNYVDRALQELVVEKKSNPSISSTTPYGCHVKYK